MLVLNTRPRGQAAELTAGLQNLGLEVLEFPTLDIELYDSAKIEERLSRMTSRDWMLFTSANGVRAASKPLRMATQSRIAVIGKATAKEVEQQKRSLDFVAQVSDSSNFATEFLSFLADCKISNIKQTSLVLLRGKSASAELPQSLRAAGWIVEEFVVYEARCPAVSDSDRKLLEENCQRITAIFTSSESLRNFCSILDLLPADDTNMAWRKRPIIVIGPRTAATAAELGFTNVSTASSARNESILQAVKERMAAAQL